MRCAASADAPAEQQRVASPLPSWACGVPALRSPSRAPRTRRRPARPASGRCERASSSGAGFHRSFTKATTAHRVGGQAAERPEGPRPVGGGQVVPERGQLLFREGGRRGDGRGQGVHVVNQDGVPPFADGQPFAIGGKRQAVRLAAAALQTADQIARRHAPATAPRFRRRPPAACRPAKTSGSRSCPRRFRAVPGRGRWRPPPTPAHAPSDTARVRPSGDMSQA